MLTYLGIENFKPFAELQSAELAPITLIYGPNSSGKSSLIQSLLLLRQSLTTPQTGDFSLIPRGAFADLGSFKSLVHKHEGARKLGLQVGFTPNKSPQSSGSMERMIRQADRKVSMTFEACSSPQSRKKDSSRLSAIEYELSGGDLLKAGLSRAPSGWGADRQPPQPFELDAVPFRWSDDQSRMSFATLHSTVPLRYPGAGRRSASWAAGAEMSEEEKREDLSARVQQLFDAVADAPFWARGSLPGRLDIAAPENASEFSRPDRISRVGFRTVFEVLQGDILRMFNSIEYLGPLRSYPERFYLIRGGAATSVGTRGENTPQVLFRGSENTQPQINSWFKAFDIPYSLTLEPLGDDVTGEIVAMHLSDSRNRVQVAPSDVGFGIGQLLPILVQGVISKAQILCVEQPEIHLHPRLQACLADFFIATAGLNSAKPSDRTVQWVTETHSEALMLRLQRRIREGTIKPDDVSVLYVWPSPEGTSHIMKLRLDESGDFIDAWPDGFFEESYNEVFSG
jgi:hypothetical protein